jgi:hypothetical protein
MPIRGIYPAALLALLISSLTYADDSEETLGTLLNSYSVSDQRAAFGKIAASPQNYVPLIRHRLVSLAGEPVQTTSRSIDRLFYLAAFLKDKSLAPPMEALLKNPDFIPYYCLYACPIIFALTVYGTSDLWTPPEEMVKARSKNSTYHDLYEGMRRAREISLDPTPWEERTRGPGVDGPLAELAGKSERELIELAGPDSMEPGERYPALLLLSYYVSSSENLNNFYWLALQEGDNGASFEPRCSLYDTIYRAEKARRTGR